MGTVVVANLCWYRNQTRDYSKALLCHPSFIQGPCYNFDQLILLKDPTYIIKGPCLGFATLPLFKDPGWTLATFHYSRTLLRLWPTYIIKGPCLDFATLTLFKDPATTLATLHYQRTQLTVLRDPSTIRLWPTYIHFHHKKDKYMLQKLTAM